MRTAHGSEADQQPSWTEQLAGRVVGSLGREADRRVAEGCERDVHAPVDECVPRKDWDAALEDGRDRPADRLSGDPAAQAGTGSGPERQELKWRGVGGLPTRWSEAVGIGEHLRVAVLDERAECDLGSGWNVAASEPDRAGGHADHDRVGRSEPQRLGHHLLNRRRDVPATRAGHYMPEPGGDVRSLRQGEEHPRHRCGDRLATRGHEDAVSYTHLTLPTTREVE